MTRHSWLTILLAVALLAPSLAVAQPDKDDDAQPGRHDAAEGRRSTEAEPITEEQETELLEALGSRYPHRRDELLKLKENKPDIYSHVITRLWHWYEEWQRLPDDAKEFAMEEQELSIQAIKLVRKWHMAEPEEQPTIMEELREVLTRKFEVNQKLREVRLAAMQKQIEQLRKENAERSANQDEIIGEQLTRALANPHGARRSSSDDETPEPPAADDED
jgi:hypothetical protein